MKKKASLLFLLRFFPALVLSIVSSIFLTLPLFQKSIGDERIGKLQQEIDAAQIYIDNNWRQGNYANGSVNHDIKNTLDEKRRLITENTAEIRKIRNAPLSSRELTFIQQMKTVVEGATTNQTELFLHIFLWLPFFMIEMIPLGMSYLDNEDDSYKATVRGLEEWRITYGKSEVIRQTENEIIEKRAKTVQTEYENREKVLDYDEQNRQLNLKYQQARQQNEPESQKLAAAETTDSQPQQTAISDHQSQRRKSFNDTPPISEHSTPSPAPASEKDESTTSGNGSMNTDDSEDPHGQREIPSSDSVKVNGSNFRSREANFLKRLRDITDTEE